MFSISKPYNRPIHARMNTILSVVPWMATLFFFFKLTLPQREAAHPADVSSSKTALYSRIGTAEVEKPTGLLLPQPDLDSALQIARAEVPWRACTRGRPAAASAAWEYRDRTTPVFGLRPGSRLCVLIFRGTVLRHGVARAFMALFDL